jgi:hypothetical protein
MKFAEARPCADPETTARRIMEIANGIDPVQGKIYIELINYPMLFQGRRHALGILGRAAICDQKGMAEV